MSNKIKALRLGVMVLGLSFAGTASSDFTGFYGGGSANLFTAVDLEETDNNNDITTNFSAEDALTRVGVIAGAGAQYGQAYYGVDGTFSLVNDLDETIVEAANEINLEGDERWSVGGRLGYVTPSNDTLFYGKIAFVAQTLELSGAISGDDDFEGVGFGIGAEYMPSDNVSIRAEAMRVNYSDESDQGVEYEPTENTVDLAILYHF